MVDGVLDHLGGHRGDKRDALRELEGALHQLGPGDDPVGQPESPRLVGVDHLAGPQEFLGLANSELPRLHQELDAGSGHPEDGVGELRVIRRDDEVAHAREHQAGGDAAALDRRDGRLAEVADPAASVHVHDLLVPELPLRRGPHRDPRVSRVGIEQGLQVMPGGEVLAGTREDDDPDGIVPVGLGKRGVQLVDHLGVLRVGRLRSLHGDGRDGAVHRVVDGLPAHVRILPRRVPSERAGDGRRTFALVLALSNLTPTSGRRARWGSG